MDSSVLVDILRDDVQAITLEEWHETYKPLTHMDGEVVRFLKRSEIPDGTPDNCVWSVTVSDTWSISSGFHVVNLDHYVVTEIPAPEGGAYVEDDEDDEDEGEEDWS